jgi:hypothetical protein
VAALSAVPFDRVIWNAQDCADYFKRPRAQFLRSIRWKNGFPKELPELPLHWRAVEVTNWALTGNPTISPESTQQAA